MTSHLVEVSATVLEDEGSAGVSLARVSAGGSCAHHGGDDVVAVVAIGALLVGPDLVGEEVGVKSEELLGCYAYVDMDFEYSFLIE